MVLGGTNLLVQDGGIRGIVLSLANLAAIEIEDTRLVFAEAGARMPVLLGFAVHHGLSGLEWAAGIPGTVGGAVVMNAGTKLGEMQDCLDAIQMVDPEGRLVTYAAADVSFAYRSVSLPEGVVVGAWLRLTPASRETIDSRTKSYLQYRKQSQPLSQPNAGSVFKNPQGTTAGRLIEEAGLKGVPGGGCASLHQACEFYRQPRTGAFRRRAPAYRNDPTGSVAANGHHVGIGMESGGRE